MSLGFQKQERTVHISLPGRARGRARACVRQRNIQKKLTRVHCPAKARVEDVRSRGEGQYVPEIARERQTLSSTREDGSWLSKTVNLLALNQKHHW